MSEVATYMILLGETSIIWTSSPGTAEMSVVEPKKTPLELEPELAQRGRLGELRTRT